MDLVSVISQKEAKKFDSFFSCNFLVDYYKKWATADEKL